GSPVTVADRGAERAAREWIQARFPADGVLGEEFGEQAGTSGRRWLIDPIDGTKSFVRGVPLWGPLVAVVEGERVLAGAACFPAAGETIAAATGGGSWHNGARARGGGPRGAARKGRRGEPQRGRRIRLPDGRDRSRGSDGRCDRQRVGSRVLRSDRRGSWRRLHRSRRRRDRVRRTLDCHQRRARGRITKDSMLDLNALDFEKGGGLVTVVAQDASTGQVLMVAFASREALERTLASGEMHYQSRSRG